MKEKTSSTMRAPNKKGPRKLKSWPLLAAQNVYRVRLTTTTAVRITASRITFPVKKQNIVSCSNMVTGFLSCVTHPHRRINCEIIPKKKKKPKA